MCASNHLNKFTIGFVTLKNIQKEVLHDILRSVCPEWGRSLFTGAKIQDGAQNPRWRPKILGSLDQNS